MQRDGAQPPREPGFQRDETGKKLVKNNGLLRQFFRAILRWS